MSVHLAISAPPAAIWDRLPADARKAIDDAIRRGAIPGLLAMRAVDPSIRLPPRQTFSHSAKMPQSPATPRANSFAARIGFHVRSTLEAHEASIMTMTGRRARTAA
ncbi:hypothetical protein [Micromonospora sp. CA-244673]|uniref:hypothetical protein n=1 Tax=Micromonospora sp. CA-244673 TaxID=3239958 RepID=UPI003D92BEC0